MKMNRISRRVSSTSFKDHVFDSHCHIIDPRFPLIANQGYLPPSFTCEEYVIQISPLSIKGGVIVSGSFQGYDQTYLIDSLKQLKTWVGVAQIPNNVSDDEIISLKTAGVRALSDRYDNNQGACKKIEQIA